MANAKLYVVETSLGNNQYKVERVYIKKELADEFVKNNASSYKYPLITTEKEANDSTLTFRVRAGTKVYFVMRVDDSNSTGKVFKVFLTEKKAVSFVKMYNAYEVEPKYNILSYFVTNQIHRFATVDCFYSPSPFSCVITARDFDSSQNNTIKWDGKNLSLSVIQLTHVEVIGKDGEIKEDAKRKYETMCEGIIEMIGEFKYGSSWRDERINKWLQDNRQRFFERQNGE